MKPKFKTLLLAASVSLLSSASNAGALKPDCTAQKAGKSAAMKATAGVGGRCSPADAAKDSAKNVAGIEEEGTLGKKGNKKDKRNPLRESDDGKKSKFKKITD